MRRYLALVFAAILITPAIAMLFTDEVAWGWEDFAAAAALIGVTWLFIEIAWHFITNHRARMAASLATGMVALVVGAHLAVGIW